MRTLSRVVCEMLVTEGHSIEREPALRCTTFSIMDVSVLPEKVKQYLKEKGAMYLIDYARTYEVWLWLMRRSDGEEEAYRFLTFFFHLKEGEERLAEIGFYPTENTKIMFGFFIEEQDYMRLCEFLRKAGVRFKYDAPPWIKDVPRRTLKVKSSSERPGDDALRFLGFG